MKNSEQYVILPKKEDGKLLEKYEILVYVCIRRYMNKDTMKAWPSLDTISKDSGCSKPTIMRVLKNIEDKGYIKIKRSRQGSIYEFNNEKSFEPFGYEFLDNKKLSKAEKLQILCCQQYMYKNNGIGKLTYTDHELAELTGLSYKMIVKNNSSLMKNNYLTKIKTEAKDELTKTFKTESVYNLTALGQAIVFKLMDHEKRLNNIEQHSEKAFARLETENAQLRHDIEILKRAIFENNKKETETFAM